MPTTDELQRPRVRSRLVVLLPLRRSPRHLLVAAAYGTALLAVVLLPLGPALNTLTVRGAQLWSAWSLPGQPTPADVGAALNVVMFVPLGLLAVRLTRRPWWQVTLAAVALSATFELYQALPVVDRMPSVGDVVTNGLGAMLGALAAAGAARRAGRSVRIPTQRRA